MKKSIQQKNVLKHNLMYFEEEAIQFIKDHEPPEGYFVGFSGGKDSIVTYDLVKKSGVKHKVYHSCTGIDHKEIYKFIKTYYPEVEFLYPKHSFLSLVKKWGPPHRKQRWCCTALKKQPANKIKLKQRIMGIRAEESLRRAKRERIDSINKKEKIYKPIFHWEEWVVWGYIDKYKLKYPILYDQGKKRIGCQVCPLVSQTLRIDSPFLRAFKKAVEVWHTNMKDIYKDGKYKNQTFDEYWEQYIGNNKKK